MTRKICLAVCLVFVGAIAFAQVQPRAVLSNADIDNFVKNYTAISEIMDSLPSADTDIKTNDDEDIRASVAKARGAKIPADVSARLARLGLGNNAYEKCIVISFGMTAAFTEEMVNAMVASGMDTNEGLSDFRKKIEEMKSSLHANDYNLIKSRIDDLVAVMQD